MTIITFTVLPVLAVASVLLFPIVNDRFDDPVGISVSNERISSAMKQVAGLSCDSIQGGIVNAQTQLTMV